MKEESAEIIIQACLFGIFTPKRDSVAILCDNGTEFKNTVLDNTYKQLGIKRLFSNPFHPKATQELRMCIIFLREHLPSFYNAVI